MDTLAYNARIFNLFYTAMQPPATPESLNEPEPELVRCEKCGCLEEESEMQYKVCADCREPEHPAEDLGYAVEVMRGERVA